MARPSRSSDKIVGLHLDLKGVMFKPRYVPQLFADLADQGINTVLVEYEDVFPFEGIDIASDPKVVMTRPLLKRFLAAAKRNGIEVIPLQQCLGHLEYRYRWKRYQRYALDAKYPSTVNLNNPGSKAMVREMLRQVIEAHPDSRFVHLGLDEARLVPEGKDAAKVDIIRIFIDYATELIEFVEGYGKTPMIWTDMLQDHFRPGPLKKFAALKDRVVFVPWDYQVQDVEYAALGRVCGFRMSRQWRDEAGNPHAPPITQSTRYFEDLPADVTRQIKPFRKGRLIRALPEVDLFTQMGFRIVGATSVRSSSEGPVLPNYNRLCGNIRAWSKAIRRNRQMGLIATSWARGTTFCPPNYRIDMTWPSITETAVACGRKPKPFWPGVPTRSVERIFSQLGRCKANWSIEQQLIDEMTALRPKVRAHRYEWDGMILMARTLKLHKWLDAVIDEVDYFHANHRPNPGEWQRRLNDHADALKQIAALRKVIRTHFARRFHGDAFEEWIADLFDRYESRIAESRRISRRKKQLAAKAYAR